jgi:methionine-rich copper-binding protein CopC
MKTLLRLSVSLLLSAVLLIDGAQAHAILLSSKIDGQDIVLHYNGRVDATRSRLTLLDQDGNHPQKLDCEAGEDQATLKTHATSVASGAYVLRWEVLSVDGHISRGDLKVSLTAP